VENHPLSAQRLLNLGALASHHRWATSRVSESHPLSARHQPPNHLHSARHRRIKLRLLDNSLQLANSLHLANSLPHPKLSRLDRTQHQLRRVRLAKSPPTSLPHPSELPHHSAHSRKQRAHLLQQPISPAASQSLLQLVRAPWHLVRQASRRSTIRPQSSMRDRRLLSRRRMRPRQQTWTGKGALCPWWRPKEPGLATKVYDNPGCEQVRRRYRISQAVTHEEELTL